ncbi:hypothetical protein ABT247_08745 [Kitasatospora sp. NPDC001539]|uniref:hypothetical protein n=1 Tax=Kitasatospora sp. NPDC001539 TaxID=3154384 RepID=UPI00332F0A9B
MLNARKPARRFAVVASLSAGLLLTSAVAAADEPPSGGAEQCFPSVICAHAGSDGTTPAPGASNPGGGGGGLDPGPQVCSYHGVEWACHDPQWGWFDSGQGCYFRPLDNPLPESDPAWEGHTAKDGSLNSKVCPQTNGGQDGAQIVFVPNGPNGQRPKTLAELKQEAFDMVRLPQPVGRIAPAGTAVVNAPVWLWAENVAPPKQGYAVAGGVSVTVTVRLTGTTWDFGDGQTKECATAGTPYDAKYGAAKSPDCGYEFRTGSGAKQNGAFSATVTTHWEADVAVTGPKPEKYTLPPLRQDSDPFAVRVGEVQVLN